MSRRDRVRQEEPESELKFESNESERPVARNRSRSPKTLRNWFERVEGRFMGSPLEIHPHEAIIWAMRVSAGEVAYCDAQIAQLHEDELFERPIRSSWNMMPSGLEEEITEYRDAEEMSRWVSWRAQAMKNMTTYAKMALDVGIEERQIKLAEEQAQQLVAVISAVLTDLGHDVRDLRTREIVRRRLMEGAIDGTASESEYERSAQ